MCNAELCAKLGRFKAFHRADARVNLPDRQTFVDAAKVRGAHACIPGLRCTVCRVHSDATTLNTLQQNGGISCFCRGGLLLSDPQYYVCMCDAGLCNRLNVFGAFHRHESRLSLPTREEFDQAVEAVQDATSSNTAKLNLRCNVCDQYTVSTTIGHLRCGGGCVHCRCKTELKLLRWLEKCFPPSPGVVITPQYRGPKTMVGPRGQTHFDFHLTFPGGFEVIIELDGAQHFWVHRDYYTDAGCERDLSKEKWAVERGLCVVRVLQEDVWHDRLDWQGWLVRSIEAARPRVLVPDAPEYRSSESAYVRLRRSVGRLDRRKSLNVLGQRVPRPHKTVSVTFKFITCPRNVASPTCHPTKATRYVPELKKYFLVSFWRWPRFLPGRVCALSSSIRYTKKNRAAMAPSHDGGDRTGFLWYAGGTHPDVRKNIIFGALF